MLAAAADAAGPGEASWQAMEYFVSDCVGAAWGRELALPHEQQPIYDSPAATRSVYSPPAAALDSTSAAAGG